MAECTSFLDEGLLFPARPKNRAALDHVRYRIARYPEFVEFLNREIDNAIELRAWTHRKADDPGIALLEGASIVADILTFYQEHYANEAFLRTANWRESIADLTRLYGYRLAPGLGGRATFAFEVRGEKPVTVERGFPIKADLEEVDAPAEFQTSDDLVAYPHLSRFHLYRQRYYVSYLPSGRTEIEIDTVGGDASAAAIDDLDLQPGDKIVLVPSEPSWTTGGTSVSGDQKTPQIIDVKGVTQALGRTVVELETPLTTWWTRPVTAYRLGRGFRHFGHTAPETYVVNAEGTGGKIDGAYEYDTSYVRHVDTSHGCTNSSASIELAPALFPLDTQVDDLTTGSRVLVQTRVRKGSGAYKPLTVVKTITGLRTTSIAFAAVTGPTTLLHLDSALIRHAEMGVDSDIRDFHFFEITSPAIQLRPLPIYSTAGFYSGVNALCYFGTRAEVRRLAGRRLILKEEAPQEGQAPRDTLVLTCTNEADDFVLPLGAPDEARMWTLSFDEPPSDFTRNDFKEDEPTVTVFGNLVDATEGKAHDEVALGNGDSRRAFQTFALPKGPLTYLLSARATPPHVPELTVYVNGRAWTRVDSFYRRGPTDEIYVVREDADGRSYVQFGDGETGARLPSGVKNVSAAWRVGTGARGPMKSGSTPSAGARFDGFDKVQLPGDVTGGAAPEDGNRAREAAPGKIQSLGRLVSVRDFETEVLSIAGVTTATAAWALDDGVPTLMLRVLLEAGRESEFEAVRATIACYQRARGPDRFPVSIEQAFLRYAYLTLRYAFDPAHRKADVEGAIRAALGLVGNDDTARTGLFGLRLRRLGTREYATRIEGCVQQVAGVRWCRVIGLGMFASGPVEPEDLTSPPSPQPRAEVLAPDRNELLQLHEAHLALVSAPVPAPEACA